VADLIGVHEMTITSWESNATIPEVRYMPAIIQFLGYNPLPLANSLAERLTAALLECPAFFVPVLMSETVQKGAEHGQRKETYG
jgi:DNA-binding XRE family transcriptional regulator